MYFRASAIPAVSNCINCITFQVLPAVYAQNEAELTVNSSNWLSSQWSEVSEQPACVHGNPDSCTIALLGLVVFCYLWRRPVSSLGALYGS